MSNAMPPTPLRQEDYLAIEAAVMETARGRWFLAEYARRNRNADTDTLLNAIDKLEKTIVREKTPSSLMNQVRMDLADMAAAIDKTKQEISQIKHEDSAGAERFERATLELDAIVSQTESATGDILSSAEKIQEMVWTLREQGADEEKCDELDMETTNIYMACSFQDLTGQRIRKIVNAMHYVESRINSMIEIWGFEAMHEGVDENDIRKNDTRPDAHLLNGPQLAGEGVEQDHVDNLFDNVEVIGEADQSDVDDLFDNPDLMEDANQNDVDALFDTPGAAATDDDGAEDMSGEDVSIDEMSFDSIDADDEDEDPDAIAFAADAEEDAAMDVAAEEPLGEDDSDSEYVEFVDMQDLDWAVEAESEAAEYLESVEAESKAEANAEEADEQADVFAEAMAEAGIEAFDAINDISDEEALAEMEAGEAGAEDEAEADVFAQAEEADDDLDAFDMSEFEVDSEVKASAEDGEASEDAEEADELRDRVAMFS